MHFSSVSDSVTVSSSPKLCSRGFWSCSLNGSLHIMLFGMSFYCMQCMPHLKISDDKILHDLSTRLSRTRSLKSKPLFAGAAMTSWSYKSLPEDFIVRNLITYLFSCTDWLCPFVTTNDIWLSRTPYYWYSCKKCQVKVIKLTYCIV